jgi:hypothetical protein
VGGERLRVPVTSHGRVGVVADLARLAAFAGLFVACGGAPGGASAGAPRATPQVLDAGAGSVGGGNAAATDALPSLDALAARGPTDAPLMREAMRVDQAAPRSPDVRADHDTCVRATFAASRSVRAWFADASGAPRGDATTAASGTVPPRGPVCAKKGEVVHLVIEDAPAPPSSTSSPALSARAVIFTSP